MSISVLITHFCYHPSTVSPTPTPHHSRIPLCLRLINANEALCRLLQVDLHPLLVETEFHPSDMLLLCNCSQSVPRVSHVLN